MLNSTLGASLEPSQIIGLGAAECKAPVDDFYEENPIGAFRGLFFAMIFNVFLVLAGAAAWELWRLVR